MKHVLLVLCMLAASAGPVFAGDPSPKDFAYGLQLVTSNGEALYEAVIPAEVYRGVTRGDLGDLRVFNGRNEIVPSAVIRPSLETAPPAESAPLPIFPVYAGVGSKAGDLSMQVKKDRNGAIINVTTGNGPGTGRVIIAYLVDARRVGKPVSALELEPRTTTEGIVSRVSVDSSSDLERWSGMARDTTIVSMRYGEHMLERRTIELYSEKPSYFRISSDDPGRMPELAGVRAILAVSAEEQDRQWQSVAAAKITEKDGYSEYSFDTAGRMPVDRIRVSLPQANTLVNATFLSGKTKEGPWVIRKSSPVYQLRLQGHDARNADIALPPCSDRYWLMRVDRGGGGLGRGVPKLDFGWVPGKLLFVARGVPPFTLAYGSSRLGPGENGLPGQLGNLRKENAPAKTAIIGPRTVLGGEAALRPGMTPRDWKTAVLWGVLVLGVSLLAWMAARLYRQMK